MCKVEGPYHGGQAHFPGVILFLLHAVVLHQVCYGCRDGRLCYDIDQPGFCV